MQQDSRRQLRENTFSAIDSDYFSLQTAPSSIPAISGLGVFAKRDIPAEVILCEYRGAILPRDEGLKVPSDKSVFLKIEEKDYVLVGDGICAMINDCRDVNKGHQECHDGFHHNARVMTLHSKVFIVSNRPIRAGEELFWDYDGDQGTYWKNWRGPKEDVKINRNGL